MGINKLKIALFWGFIILLSHIALSGYLWFIFTPGVDDRVAVAEISLPMTVTYAVTIVKYFVDGQTRTEGGQSVPLAYFLVTAIVILPFLFALFFLPHQYTSGKIGIEALNNSYVFLEGALGALFVIVFNDLFKASNVPPQG
jgi:hypothetical protein